MNETRKVKISLLAATSLLSAAAALAPAHANDLDAAAFPTIVEAPAVAAHDEAVLKNDRVGVAQRAGLIAIGLGALGWLVRLIGPKKVIRAVEKTAEATVKASSAAAKTAIRAVRSPLRFAAWMAGLALFALAGVGFYDIEWIGGLMAGAAITGLSVFGALKSRAALRFAPVRHRRAPQEKSEKH
ncbi:MAG: hypothetical protein AAFW81_09550 [Pseudomonadota bacterium]